MISAATRSRWRSPWKTAPGCVLRDATEPFRPFRFSAHRRFPGVCKKQKPELEATGPASVGMLTERDENLWTEVFLGGTSAAGPGLPNAPSFTDKSLRTVHKRL